MQLEELAETVSELLLPYGELGLFILSFFNSSFSPVPSEVVLIPLVMLQPENALWLAFVATLGSSLGAVFGYYIGVYGGRPVIERISSKSHEKIHYYIDKHGLFIVGASGISPFPFKVFCIGAGVFGLDPKKLFLVSMLFRGVRFFSIALVIVWYGETGAQLIEENMFIAFLVVSVLLIGGYVAYIKGREHL